MTRDQCQQKITAKLAQLPDSEAIKVYAALRGAIMQAQARRQRAGRDAWQAMIMTGNALEARIGTDDFEALMDQIDAAATEAAA
jgi:hypothetical protein